MDGQAGLSQCQPQCLNVYRFKKSLPELIVDVKEHADDPSGKLLMLELVPISVHPWPMGLQDEGTPLTEPICIR